MTAGSWEGSIRAGNADREQVVAQLNAAFAEGRLDVAELDERVAAAYAAKTLGELGPLTADLPPSPVPARRSAPPARRAEDRPEPAGGSSGVTHWAPVGAAFGVFLLNVVIWGAVSLGNGHPVYFWPIWVAIPLALALIRVVTSGGHGRDRR